MKVQRLTSLHELGQVVTEWKELLARSQSENVFLTPSFVTAWFRALGDGYELYVLTARSETGTLVGLWPLMIREYRLGFRKLEFVGTQFTDYHQVLMEPALAGEILTAFLQYLMARAGDWDMLDLSKLPAFADVDQLATRLSERLVVARTIQTIAPHLPLAGGWETVRSSWKKGFVADTQRQHRRLQTMGELTVGEWVPADLEMGVRCLLNLHKGRWNLKGEQSAYAASPSLGRMLLGVSAALHAEGLLHFSYLSLGSEVIATHLGFQMRGRFFYMKPAFAPEFRSYSPGTVLLFQLIQMCCQQGFHTFDFLLGDEPYKLRFTDSAMDIWSIRAYQANLRGKMLRKWFEEIRPIVKNALRPGG